MKRVNFTCNESFTQTTSLQKLDPELYFLLLVNYYFIHVLIKFIAFKNPLSISSLWSTDLQFIYRDRFVIPCASIPRLHTSLNAKCTNILAPRTLLARCQYPNGRDQRQSHQKIFYIGNNIHNDLNFLKLSVTSIAIYNFYKVHIY